MLAEIQHHKLGVDLPARQAPLIEIYCSTSARTLGAQLGMALWAGSNMLRFASRNMAETIVGFQQQW